MKIYTIRNKGKTRREQREELNHSFGTISIKRVNYSTNFRTCYVYINEYRNFQR